MLSEDSSSQSTAGKGFGKKVVPPPVPEIEKSAIQTDRTNTTPRAGESEEQRYLYETPRARREAELDEKIKRLREEEELLATDPSVGAVPELVANRMIGRIAAFFGIPVFGG